MKSSEGTELEKRPPWWRRLLRPAVEEKPFDFDGYITTRRRGPLEQKFHEEVQRLSAGQLSVEDVQRLLNRVHSRIEAMQVLLPQLTLHGQQQTERFTKDLSKLWEHTPRTELAGQTPMERETSEHPVHETATVGRNDPCPCGSGKKYKKCCGARPGSA